MKPVYATRKAHSTDVIWKDRGRRFNLNTVACSALKPPQRKEMRWIEDNFITPIPSRFHELNRDVAGTS
jgi:hypothetical protein